MLIAIIKAVYLILIFVLLLVLSVGGFWLTIDKSWRERQGGK